MERGVKIRKDGKEGERRGERTNGRAGEREGEEEGGRGEGFTYVLQATDSAVRDRQPVRRQPDAFDISIERTALTLSTGTGNIKDDDSRIRNLVGIRRWRAKGRRSRASHTRRGRFHDRFLGVEIEGRGVMERREEEKRDERVGVVEKVRTEWMWVAGLPTRERTYD